MTMSVFVRAGIRAGVTMLVVCALALALLSNRSAQSDPGHREPGTSIEPVELLGRDCVAMPSPEAGWHGTSCDPSTSSREAEAGWSSQ
jgi:hypothetical protein